MGKLLITAVPSQQVAQAAASRQVTPSPTTPQGPAPGVAAVIQFGKNEYRFNVEGISMGDIIDMPCLIPTLEKLIACQRRPPRIAGIGEQFRDAKFYDDPEYQIPRHLTFLINGNPSETIIIAGSGRALYNLVLEIIDSKKKAPKILSIHDKDRCYLAGFIFKSGLELLPKLVPKIQPMHLSALTTLQMLVAIDSKPALNMLGDLLKRQCLSQLKTLNLPYATGHRAKKTKKGIYYFTDNHPAKYLSNLYQILSTQQQLPKLEHLRLILWCEEMNRAGLQVLGILYSHLKTLVIDAVTPTAQLLIWEKKSRETSSSLAYNARGDTSFKVDVEDSIEIRYRLDFPPKSAGQPTFIDFLREHAGESQVESVEVYNWLAGEKEPLPDLNILQQAISQRWLPKLNSIVLRPNADEFFVRTPLTSRDTWLDTQDLLNAVIEQKLPLVNLQLLMPEQNSCIPWLEHLANGGFPTLHRLGLRVPDPFIEPGTLRKESEETHYPRLIHALTLIFNAIVERRVPELESVIFEGELPEPFAHLVENIESALQQMQSQPAALAACYI